MILLQPGVGADDGLEEGGDDRRHEQPDTRAHPCRRQNRQDSEHEYDTEVCARLRPVDRGQRAGREHHHHRGDRGGALGPQTTLLVGGAQSQGLVTASEPQTELFAQILVARALGELEMEPVGGAPGLVQGLGGPGLWPAVVCRSPGAAVGEDRRSRPADQGRHDTGLRP